MVSVQVHGPTLVVTANGVRYGLSLSHTCMIISAGDVTERTHGLLGQLNIIITKATYVGCDFRIGKNDGKASDIPSLWPGCNLDRRTT